MAIPELDLATISHWCSDLVPDDVKPQLRYEADVTHNRYVTIMEVRPHWQDPTKETRFPVARLRYTAARNEWQLYWRDRNLEFHVYDWDGEQPTSDVVQLLETIRADPHCIFFG